MLCLDRSPGAGADQGEKGTMTPKLKNESACEAHAANDRSYDRMGIRDALRGGREINCSETVGEYISGADWRIKANANVGYSHAGLISNVAGKVIANFWLD